MPHWGIHQYFNYMLSVRYISGRSKRNHMEATGHPKDVDKSDHLPIDDARVTNWWIDNASVNLMHQVYRQYGTRTFGVTVSLITFSIINGYTSWHSIPGLEWACSTDVMSYNGSLILSSTIYIRLIWCLYVDITSVLTYI